MGKIVLNQLQLNGSVVGYRFDLMNSDGGRIVSFDVNTVNAKAFLSMVNADSVEKGRVIKGKEVNGVFVTPDESNVIEVTTKKSAVDLLGVYFGDVSVANKSDGTSTGDSSPYKWDNPADLYFALKGVQDKYYGGSKTLPCPWDSPEARFADKYIAEALMGVEGFMHEWEDDDPYYANVYTEGYPCVQYKAMFTFKNYKEYLRFIYNLSNILKLKSIRIFGNVNGGDKSGSVYREYPISGFKDFLCALFKDLGITKSLWSKENGCETYPYLWIEPEFGHHYKDYLDDGCVKFRMQFPPAKDSGNDLGSTDSKLYYIPVLHVGGVPGHDYCDVSKMFPFSGSYIPKVLDLPK